MALTNNELSRLDSSFPQEQVDPVFQRLDEEFGNDISTSLEIASKRDPDNHAENLRLAESNELPVDTVERNKDEVSRRDRLKHLDLSEYKKLEQYFSDPDNASVSIDDIEPLKKIEDASNEGVLGSPWALMERWIGGTASLIKSGENLLPEVEEQLKQQMRGRFSGLYEAGGLKASKAPPPMWEPISREDQFKPEIFEKQEQRKEALEEETVKAIDSLMKEIEGGDKKIEELTPKDLSLWQQGVRGGVSSALIQAPLIATSFLTGQPWLAPVLMTEQVAAESFGKAGAAGKTGLERLSYTAEQAGAEYIGERWSIKPLAKIFERSGDLGKNFFEYVLKEVIQEEGTGVAQGISDYVHGFDKEMEAAFDAGDYKKAWGIAGDRAIVTAIAAVVGSGTQATAMAGLGKSIEVLAADKSQSRNFGRILESLNDQERIDNLIIGSQETRTLGRSPERFDVFMQSLGDRSVYITQDAAAQMKDPPDYITDQLSDFGSDIEIPLNRFVEDLAPNQEIMSVIRPHIRLSAAGLTSNEIEAGENDSLNNLMRKAQENADIKTESDAIFEEIVPQLTATGRMSEQSARTSAAIIPAYITTYVAKIRAEGHEITVAQAYQDMFKGEGLRIAGPDVEVGATPDVIVDQAPESPYAPGQDFGDMVYEQDVTHAETGKPRKVRQKVQDMWDNTQDRRSQLTQLMDCLSA